MMFPIKTEFQDNEYVVKVEYWEDGRLHLSYQEKGDDTVYTEKKGLTLGELIETWPEDGVAEEDED